MHQSSFPLTICALVWAATARAQDVVSWTSPADGQFGLATNWTPSRVPGPLDIAFLGFAMPYEVVIDEPVSVSAVELANPLATLRLINATELELDSLSGPGLLRMESSAVSPRSQLSVAGGGLIDSRVELLVTPGEPSGYILTHAGGPPATIGPQGVVSGHGLMEGDWHNAGLLEIAGGRLVLSNGDITQEPTGRILIRNGEEFRIANHAIRGGMLTVEPDGNLDPNRGILDGVTIEGLVHLRAGKSIILEGDVFFDEILMNGTESTLITDLFGEAGATLHGRITMAGRVDRPLATALRQLGGTAAPAIIGPGSVVDITAGRIDDNWENRGLFQIRPDGILHFDRPLRQSPLGIVQAGEGSELVNAQIIGGRVEFAPGSRFVGSGGFGDAVVTGALAVQSGETMTGIDGARIEGPTLVNTLGSAEDTRFEIRSGSRIEGNVTLNGNPDFWLSAVFGGDNFDGNRPIIAPGVTISGFGHVRDYFINEGVITAHGADQAITLWKGGIRQRGDGMIIAQDGGRLIFEGMALQGGTLDARGGSCTITLNPIRNNALTNVSVAGPLTFEPGATLAIGEGTRFEAPLLVPAGSDEPTVVTMLDDSVFRDVLRLDALPTDLAGARFEAERGHAASIGVDAVVEGSGEINGQFGEFFLEGTLSPGVGSGTGAVTGSLLHNGEMIIAPPGRIAIDIIGPSEYDAIVGDGRMTLGGTLELRLADGFDPAGGTAFTVITQGLLSGFVDRIEVDPPVSFGPAHAITTDETVTVVLCAADRDGDGTLTVFDFLEFQNQFDAGSRWADLDGDGSLTIFDFLAFQTAFDAGCV